MLFIFLSETDHKYGTFATNPLPQLVLVYDIFCVSSLSGKCGPQSHQPSWGKLPFLFPVHGLVSANMAAHWWLGCLSSCFFFFSDIFQSVRVRTGHGKPGKSWNFRISFSRPGKSWNLIVGPWKLWKVIKVKMTKRGQLKNGIHFGGHRSLCLLNFVRSKSKTQKVFDWQLNWRSWETWKGHGNSHAKAWNLKSLRVRTLLLTLWLLDTFASPLA